MKDPEGSLVRAPDSDFDSFAPALVRVLAGTFMTSSIPLLLALDTAQEDCAAALLRDGKLLAVRCEHVGNRHAECVLGLIDAVLAEAGETKANLSAVAFGAGPGSFTGLRVACGVAQGLAWALRLPVLAVSNLEAAALLAAREKGLAPGERIFVANDARMNECYAALYEVCDPATGRYFTCLTEPALLKPEAVPAAAREGGAKLVAGSAPVQFPEVFDATRLEGIELYPRTASAPEEIALLGEAMFRRGEAVEPQAAAPIYVRNRVALTMAERAAGEKL